MKKNMKKILSVVGICIVTIGSLVGCGNQNATSSATVSSEVQTSVVNPQQESSVVPSEVKEAVVELNGTILMVGSTSMEKLANALAESFMNVHQGVTVNAELLGPSAGVEEAL